MRQIIASSLPGIKIERLLPGAYNGEYAWQLFIKTETDIIIGFTASRTVSRSATATAFRAVNEA